MDAINVGDLVHISQCRPGGGVSHMGTVKVTKVGKNKIATADGRMWRIDGYEWGTLPMRGMGRAFEKRIDKMA